MKQKIVPHLWYDDQAKEAAEFYVSAFGRDSKITGITTLHGTPSGEVDTVSFALLDYSFMAISAGPLFKPNPSISFFVQLDSVEEVNRLWSELKKDGEIMMPLDAYPWSERYGRLQDRYGITWQISLGDKKDTGGQYITPCLMFTGDQYGKAEEALHLYTSVFPNSEIEGILRFGKNETPDKEGNVKHAQFKLEKQTFMIMESGHDHPFGFNEAISLIVNCDDQQEIDHFWEKLSAVPESEQCGWIKDEYGVSWQIVPGIMDEMMIKGTREQVDRLTQTFLPMKKLIISELEEAYNQTRG